MKITIYQNREVYKEESKIGNDSENKVETLEFEFPEEYRDFTKYIEFQIKGEKYVDLIEDNKYVITREVAKYGKIKTQIVLKKNTENDVMVFKSDIFTLNVSNSINATENLVNTVGVDLIEKIITKNNEQDTRLDILEADNATNKENISSIQDRQVTQDNRIDDLEADNTSNKSRITDIETKNVEQDNKIVSLESKNTEQDTNIQKNTADIKTINEKNKSQDTEITNIKSEQATQNTNIQNNTKSIEEINQKDKNQDNLIEELQTENTKLKKTIESMQIPGEEVGNPIHISDSSDMECEIVPIGNAEQETREGYNLLDLSGFTSVDKNGIVATKNEDGSIKLNGTSTAGLGIHIPINKTLSSGSYKHSIGTVIPEGVYISLDNTSNTLISNSTGSKKNFEITEETSYTNYLIWINANVTLSNLTIYPMLYQGTEDKPYEPYGASPSPDYPSEIVTVGQNGSVEIVVDNGLETTDTNYQSYTKVLPIQKEFVKIGDVEDTFVKVDGKWYEKHCISKEIFNGEETWYRDALQGDNKYYSFYTGLTPGALGDSKCLCNLLPYNNGIYSTDRLGIFINWQGNARLKLKIDTITTVDELKEYLTANNITVYYILATPELIPCTAEQSAILNSFYTYKNVTNISVDGIATLKVNYKKDLETLFNNINSALLS